MSAVLYPLTCGGRGGERLTPHPPSPDWLEEPGDISDYTFPCHKSCFVWFWRGGHKEWNETNRVESEIALQIISFPTPPHSLTFFSHTPLIQASPILPSKYCLLLPLAPHELGEETADFSDNTFSCHKSRFVWFWIGVTRSRLFPSEQN